MLHDWYVKECVLNALAYTKIFLGINSILHTNNILINNFGQIHHRFFNRNCRTNHNLREWNVVDRGLTIIQDYVERRRIPVQPDAVDIINAEGDTCEAKDAPQEPFVHWL